MRIGERWSCARGPRRLPRALTSPRICRDLTLAVSCEAKDSHTYVLLKTCQQVASEVHRQATGEQTSGQATPTFSDATSVAAGSIPRLRKRASRSAASALNSLCICLRQSLRAPEKKKSGASRKPWRDHPARGLPRIRKGRGRMRRMRTGAAPIERTTSFWMPASGLQVDVEMCRARVVRCCWRVATGAAVGC